MRGLLDTSVFVGQETDRELGALPDEAALSVITIEELSLGVRMAVGRGEAALAATRQTTLDRVVRAFDVLPVDRQVAQNSALIRASGRLRGLRFGPLDALIAATAVTYGLTLFSQDAQFAEMDGVEVRLV
ncbi:MAG: PIN domain-containing protein [Geodermatophilaceae bacterium]|nr:PIN domain-containing protein [Geodermatophilaceae bacterium]MDQ3456418.1 PIN domain-containing protein [Actinomycetota bacterium]